MRLHQNLVKSADRTDDAGELRRNRRIVDVGVARLAIHQEAVDLHAERFLHVGNRALRTDGVIELVHR